MTHRITVYIIDPTDKKIHVEHSFYGRTLQEAQAWRDRHIGACEYFHAAEAGGNLAEESDVIDQIDWPTYEEEGVRTLDMEPEEET